MAYRKIRVCTSFCPYCNSTISKEYNGPAVWGPKYGRCAKCKKIFKTGKRLYSDVSEQEKEKDKKELLQVVGGGIPLFIIAIIVRCVTGWILVGLVEFFIFFDCRNSNEY